MMLFGAAPQTDHPQSTAGVVTFDAPGAGTKADSLQGTTALGINASGEIVGSVIDSLSVHHGYVRTADGTITKFDVAGAGTFGNQGTLAWGIDAGGDVTGYYTDTNQIFHGYIRAASGAITTFDAPGAVTANGYNQGTTPFAIDAAGDVTGYYTGSNGALHGFVRSAAGAFTSFDVTGAGTGSNQGTRPISINSSGEIAGVYLDSNTLNHGFFRSASGTITTFDVPSAGTGKLQGTFPTAIDAAGDITGFYGSGTNSVHGFIRTAAGTFTTIDAPSAGTGILQGTLPFGINTSGAIAGLYIDSTGLFHGFSRTASGTLSPIDAPGAGTTGTAISSANSNLEGTGAFGINDSGAVAGFDSDSSAVAHGFLLPAPASVPPSFTVAGTAVSVAPGATTGNTSTITITPAGGFTGAVALTASVTGPTGASDPPTFSFGSTTPVTITGTSVGTATLTISTTAASTASLAHPSRRQLRWYGAGSAVLACVLFFALPARNRGWIRLLSLLLFCAAIGGGLLGCGGSGGGSTTTGPTNPGTTPGSYVVTVTGTSGSTTAMGTVALTVQ